jgi:hypothetical protein
MRRPMTILILFFLGATVSAHAASGRVIKVLPHLMDLKGHHTLSPSLYERDAYQQHLRQHPEKRSGVRVDVQWKSSGRTFGQLKLRVELRGSTQSAAAVVKTLETEVKSTGWFSRWTALPLTGEEYKELGDVTAWRVTLWDDGQLLSEQTSFLW